MNSKRTLGLKVNVKILYPINPPTSTNECAVHEATGCEALSLSIHEYLNYS